MIIFAKETLREALRGLRVLKLSKQILPAHQRVLVFGYEDAVEFTGTNLDQYLRFEGLGMSSAVKGDPIRRDAAPMACIDHICARRDSAWRPEPAIRWPAGPHPDAHLSDHFGIAVTFKGVRVEN